MAQFMPILVLGGMVLIFVGTYVLNKRTPVPEMESDMDTAQCKSCKIVTCGYHGGDE